MLAVVQSILEMRIVNDVKGYLAARAAPKRDILCAGQSDFLQLEAATILAFAAHKVDKIGLSSRDRVKKLCKLLNDDYLTSGLTAFEYETLAKKGCSSFLPVPPYMFALRTCVVHAENWKNLRSRCSECTYVRLVSQGTGPSNEGLAEQ